MTPVVHCSAGSIHFFPRTTTSIPHREIYLTKPNVSCNSKRSALSQRYLFSQSALNPFQIYRSGYLCKDGSRFQSIAAVGSDLAVEESNPAVSKETTEKTSEAPPTSAETSESTSTNPVVNAARSKRPRGVRKSDLPPVKNEDLTPGASFTGKVRSIQPFGAFVDFGAFTDGLVHVSRMSDGYVKDVASLVSVGQEVKVRIVEANMETGRISLTMRESDDPTKPQQSSDRPRPARKNAARSTQKPDEAQKSTKFVKGQVLTGTIKNTIRAGSFVLLPDGEEGFIPTSEEAGGSDSFMGNSSLQIGQEVNVRVLRITRGQVTLTMKEEEVDVKELNKQLNKGVVHTATNPFELAFRRNKDIAAFLNDRESAQKSSEDVNLPRASEGEDRVDGTVTKPDAIVVDDSTTSVEPRSGELVHGDEERFSNLPQSIDSVQEVLSESTSESDSTEIPVADDSSSKSLVSEESVSSTSLVTDEISIVEGRNEADIKTVGVTQENLTSEAPTVDEDPAKDEIKETVVESAVVPENDVSSKSLETGEDGSSADPIIVDDSAPEASDQILASNIDVCEGDERTEADGTTEKLETQAIVVLEDEATRANSNNIETGSPEISSGQAGTSQQSDAAKSTISPALVKQLREETGAGMMDCKMALSETGGDIVKAQEFLRKKGLASADKKSSRATAEGRIGSYIHDSRIGILIEVNCETDFVSRGEIFKELVDDLAMQVAACPQVSYLVTEDVPEEIVNKEREIEMQKEDLLSKPEQIRPKIVEGRIRKRLEEFALLEQPFIKNDKVLVKDLVKQTIATIGENIKVKRFVRYNLGEGLEKRSQDFASEVAAQTVAKESPTAPKDQPVEIKETVDKPPAIAISAALVKQLREESGAGMMDCKKALTETGGDLEKAQEYLRKKGLSSAEKKSTRIAAEGRVSAYVHDTRIGCLIEVNSETDFVARNERFKELVDDLAMQVVACPQVEFVSLEEIPESVVNKEKEIEMQRDDLKSKPENIREKIVEGRISKRLGELALLEQPFIKNDKVLVKDLVKQTVAALGENIRVRRFVRFTLGETTD